ncbi:L2 [Eidolon helvum papillomavirus 1]|uniref:Minor capsid protein L2 n=1 Tax=Eidolon helvum papillomavirus 1 TaxID=1163701 RepID=S4TH18_9PAPI|nr:L2 [Eidolon helvum papillomavirus 1]AGB34180.1 L2 [Eidolon helvum papillomavirus 1]
MTLKVRRKRAAVKDLYPTCKIFNTCPADVIPKVEGTTIADKILQWGGSGVYFGTLGIGTGRSGGGIPLGTPFGGGGGGRGPPVVTLKPSLPLDTIMPEVSIPIDVAATPAAIPTDPSIIDLYDYPGAPYGPESIPGVVNGNTQIVVADVHPLPQEPTIVLTGEDPFGPPDTTFIETGVVSRTQYNNPTFEIEIGTNLTVGESSASDQVHVTGTSGSFIGPQEIPLLDITPSEVATRSRTFDTEIEAETEFGTSTPITTQRPARTGLYSKRYAQVRVREPEIITRPRVQYFTNPAFEDIEAIDPDVSFIFERDQQQLARELPGELADVARLSKVTYSRTPSGLVRASRIGRSYTIRTRTGVQIGAQTHFFTDLTPITRVEEFELHTLVETSNESSIVQPLAESSFDRVDLDEVTGPVSDDQLLDEDSIEFSGTLELHGVEPVAINEAPVRPTFLDYVVKPPIYIENISGQVLFPTTTGEEDEMVITPAPTSHDVPIIVVDATSQDFYLHPYLQHKKRKRKHFVYMFADGSVASEYQ